MKPKGAGARSRPDARLPLLLLIGWLATLGFLTLTPAPLASDIPPFACLLCSERALADAVANILLFVPLGILLNLNGLGLRGALVAALALSGAIEACQFLVPGRFPDLSDILTNGAGGVLGVVGGRRPDRWILPSSPWRPRLFLGSVLLASGLPFLTGFLLAPVLPEEPLRALWTPDMPYLERWEGHLQAVTLGGSSLPDGATLTPEQVAALRVGGPLRMRAVGGAAPGRLAPVLRIVDDGGTEVRLLGIRGTDLVWLARNRAQQLRLDLPETRWEGPLQGVVAGEELQMGVEPGPGDTCLQVEERTACGLGHHAGRGWALLLSARWLPGKTQALLDHLWLGGMLLLVGFWTPPGMAGAPLAGLLAPLAALALSGLLPWLGPAPGTALAAGAAGWFLGWRAGVYIGGAGGAPVGLRGRRAGPE